VLSLAVSRESTGDSLEILGGRGFRSPLLVKLGYRDGRGLQRQPSGPVWNNLVAPLANFNEFADLKVELSNCRGNGSMVAG
jgi:hypothetical protein